MESSRCQHLNVKSNTKKVFLPGKQAGSILALNQNLEHMKTKIGILLIALLVMSSFHYRMTRTITGKVTAAEDASALPGVNINLKGTSKGTVTDVFGNYSITIPDAGGTLVFSFIGLKTKEIKIGSKDVINVTMSQETCAA